jgi:hypothetical protein
VKRSLKRSPVSSQFFFSYAHEYRSSHFCHILRFFYDSTEPVTGVLLSPRAECNLSHFPFLVSHKNPKHKHATQPTNNRYTQYYTAINTIRQQTMSKPITTWSVTSTTRLVAPSLHQRTSKLPPLPPLFLGGVIINNNKTRKQPLVEILQEALDIVDFGFDFDNSNDDDDVECDHPHVSAKKALQ